MASTEKPYLSARPDVSLPKLEEEHVKYWKDHKTFEKSLYRGEGRKPFRFYDGPPFATGLPHYGHLIGAIMKDIVPRYQTMKGFTVERVFGWDCHGLPVENEINKTHGFQSRKQIMEYGVAKYNDLCRGIVQRYSNEWKSTIHRIGRWVDMEVAYFTMSNDFMQSVWWVVKQLYDKGLVYEGYKVVPYSTGLSTSLSNFEATQNYKSVQDPAITVMFPLKSDPTVSFLAWTTTPWTLPSNMALAVGSDHDYIKVKEKSTDRTFIFAKALIGSVFKNPDEEVEILEEMKGSRLIGQQYQPIFNYFLDKEKEGAFKVIHGDHVTTDSGTGIVHTAPAHGEEDFVAAKAAKVPLVNPVDDDGMYTAEIGPHQGKRVKEVDKDIIAEIKAMHRLFKHETITHSVAFCYRTETPLINRAVSSWFVSVEKLKAEMIKANSETHWVPETIRDGRFGNWLENARDWAISRNRFWGSPIPIWRNDEGEMICIGSIAELEKLSGKKVNDLHIEHVDPIEIPSPTGKSPLKRTQGVLDCWFESGSMPYAQWGYPFKNKEIAEQNFPADFIGEGLDQTRGWFYTLTVIGTALFGKSPFKNVIVNGMILAEDGKKMSKSLRNYPDPSDILNKHGADALRLYLIESPAIRAQELRFSEKGVNDIVRKVLLRWWNSYSFFVNYANIDNFVPKGDAYQSPNLLDQWVLSRLNSLIENTEKEMALYHLYNVVPQLLQFIEELTNTYIRFNRSHFWANGMPEDKRFAYETLYEVLYTLSKVMAPFTPFMSETTFQNLNRVQKVKSESVHLETFPNLNRQAIKPELEEAVHVMEALVMLGRTHRERISVKAKIPLLTMKIIHREKRVLENLKRFEPYFRDELNIRDIQYVSNEDDYVQISAKANFPVLGKRMGAKMKAVAAGIMKLSLGDLLKLESGATLTVEGEAITLGDVEIRRSAKQNKNDNMSIHQLVSIEVDPTVNRDQILEGMAREVVRKVQAARKNADFNLDDRIHLELHCDGDLRVAVDEHQTSLMDETLTLKFTWSSSPKGEHTETVEIEEGAIKIGIQRAPKS